MGEDTQPRGRSDTAGFAEAAVAMWWSVDAADRAEFHEWHSKEHLPERLGIPGFRRGTRWQDGEGGAFFVLYELADPAVLTSAGYLARLNDPTPWSIAMMPRHRGMVRSQCRIRAASGQGVARILHTIRLSPRAGQQDRLESHLRGLVAEAPRVPGLTRALLLQTQTPDAAPTAEQKIRGGDGVADWILLVGGHDPVAWRRLSGDGFEPRLIAAGAEDGITIDRFDFVHGLSALDMQAAAGAPS